MRTNSNSEENFRIVESGMVRLALACSQQYGPAEA